MSRARWYVVKGLVSHHRLSWNSSKVFQRVLGLSSVPLFISLANKWDYLLYPPKDRGLHSPRMNSFTSSCCHYPLDRYCFKDPWVGQLWEDKSARFPKPRLVPLHHLHGLLGQLVSPLGSHLFHISYGKVAAPLPMNHPKWQGSSVQGSQCVCFICPDQPHARATASCQLPLCTATPAYTLTAC